MARLRAAVLILVAAAAGILAAPASARTICKIRTSFGGTKPLRTDRMRFVYDLRS